MPDSTAQDPGFPAVFGRYVLLRRLSRGGMGEIFLARVGEMVGFQKPIIIKKILPHLSADEEFVTRFIDEAKVAIQLQHTNIASVYEVGRVDGEYFLALEYIEGRDLRRLIARCQERGTRLPPELALYVTRELSSGLGYAHRRTDSAGRELGVVHCDISPPNVMVSFEGEVKVIDFGIAKSRSRMTVTNPNVGFGKLGYMAPEQLVRTGADGPSAPAIDRRTDIYAAGVVLYELLTGQRLYPFPPGASFRDHARRVVRGEFVRPSVRMPGLDPQIDAVVCRALAVRREARFQCAEALRDALQEQLVRMNPTVSADQLAAFMRAVFADELSAERAILAGVQTLDAAAVYRDRRADLQHETITYAHVAALAAPVVPAPAESAGQALETRRSPLIIPRRRMAIAVAVLTLCMAIASLLIVLHRQSTHPRPSPEVAPKPPPALPPEWIVTPLPVAPPPAESVAKPGPGHAKRGRRREPRTAAKPATAASTNAVTNKFRRIKREYDRFSMEHGPRLEEQWNAIVHEITFGDQEKLERVDRMLDALHRQMEAIRRAPR